MIKKNNIWDNPSKWDLFIRKIKLYFNRWKIFDSFKYYITPKEDRKLIFKLTQEEYEKSEQIYKDKGTIEYTFYPIGGIGWGVKIKVWKTNEYIDITDYDKL